MKIKLSVEVTDNERLYLARLLPSARRTGAGMLTKQATQDHLNDQLYKYLRVLSADFWDSHSKPLTDEEKRDASAAIEYMRAQGKSDGTIRAWLIMQRARLHFPPKKEL